MRALRARQGAGADATLWAHDVAREYRNLLLAGAVEKLEVRVVRSGSLETRRTRKGMSAEEVAREKEREKERADLL